MELRATNIRTQFTELGKQEIVLTVEGKHNIHELKDRTAKGKLLSVDIKAHRNRRSTDANAYCWVLCQKIAEVIGSTRELVYQTFIREVGQFQQVPVKNDAVERWMEIWKGKGIGWFSEVERESKLQGYTVVRSYYGSSVYDTREMSVLIDEIVTECQGLGIETMPPAEIDRLKSQWEVEQ